jgi:hypothetical protein
MAQLRLTETTAAMIRDRYQTLFAKAFAPNIRYEQMPAADERMPRIGLARSARNWDVS